MPYIVQRSNRFYVVAYLGQDPITGRERRRWHSGATSTTASSLSIVRSRQATMGRTVEGHVKTRASRRRIDLDTGTVLLGHWRQHLVTEGRRSSDGDAWAKKRDAMTDRRVNGARRPRPPGQQHLR